MKKGFTLIEFLIVAVFVGILAAIAVPKLKAIKAEQDAAQRLVISSTEGQPLFSGITNTDTLFVSSNGHRFVCIDGHLTIRTVH